MKSLCVRFRSLLVIGALLSLGLSATGFGQALPTWTGSFNYQRHPYTYTMVGTTPSTNTSTTIPVYLIPLAFAFDVSKCNSLQTTFDPYTVLPNGRTVVQNVIDSPIFDFTTDYMEGSVDLGYTQYIDAFQRGNFWNEIPTPKNYHLLLQNPPTVLQYPQIQVPYPSGGQAEEEPNNGGCVGALDPGWWTERGAPGLNYFENTILAHFIADGEIQPNSLALFLLYDVFAGSSGRHEDVLVAGNPTPKNYTYAWAAYNGYNCDPAICQAHDVSIIAHEVAEWADDPYPRTSVSQGACGLEVGDPFDHSPHIHYFQKTVHGFTYSLQDLAFLPYFGGDPNTSVNGWFDFMDLASMVCQPFL